MPTSLATVAWIDRAFSEERIPYWIFGGFAVDFYVGEETRPHADVDVAVLRSDFARATSHLIAHGWTLSSEGDGYATFEREGALVDLAPVTRDDGAWAVGAFGDDEGELVGVRARLVSRAALIADKTEHHGDETSRSKDDADLQRLVRGKKKG